MRVERLENIIAMVLPRRLFWRLWCNPPPDLMVDLWAEALRMRVVSSMGVRSAIESRCLGAKGEVGGVSAIEELYVRICLTLFRMQLLEGRRRRDIGAIAALNVGSLILCVVEFEDSQQCNASELWR